MLARHLLILTFFFSTSAWSYFQVDMMKGKINAKAQSRWTLADWLSQKSRNRLQDQWLSMNRSADWFELNLGGVYSSYRLKTVDVNGVTEAQHSAVAYHTDVFLSLVNFFGEYEMANNRIESYGAGAGIRLLGSSSQSTNLILRYGWRKRQSLRQFEKWENEFAEALTQLYIFKSFGLTARYRQYGANRSNLENTYSGTRLTAGAFVEYGILRAYVDFYREPTQIDRAGELTEERREGVESGLRFHF